jgi:hypothetical protein
MKLCIHCRHHTEPDAGIHVCDSPNLPEDINPVDGKPLEKYCTTMRLFQCGPEGNWFEPADHRPVDRVCPVCGRKHTGSFNECAACAATQP